MLQILPSVALRLWSVLAAFEDQMSLRDTT
jgi:hypothetical protein